MIRTNGKGEAYYMCPRCTSVYKISGITERIPYYVFEDDKVEGVHLFDFVFPCKTCGNLSNENIDPNIIREIAIMNRKGFVTHSCCEGHDDNTGPDFYIAFSVDRKYVGKMNDIIKQIPEEWELSKRGFRSYVLRVKLTNWYIGLEFEKDGTFKFDSMISEDEYTKKKKRYLKQFKEIIKSLPTLHGEKINNRVVPIEYKVRSI